MIDQEAVLRFHFVYQIKLKTKFLIQHEGSTVPVTLVHRGKQQVTVVFEDGTREKIHLRTILMPKDFDFFSEVPTEKELLSESLVRAA